MAEAEEVVPAAIDGGEGEGGDDGSLIGERSDGEEGSAVKDKWRRKR